MITPIAENLWLLAYPLSKLGMNLRRNVTIIRLSSGDLVIHSTGPFTSDDLAEISALGRPGWLVEAMLHHDTFAKEGRAAFPGIPYLAPPGFSELVDIPTEPIIPAPAAWGSELQVLPVPGMPGFDEHVFFHQLTRTLIVADLVFNFGPDEPVWTELMLKAVVGGKHEPGMGRPFKMGIKGEEAFNAAMEKMLRWDFDRVIVGHGDHIPTDGKQKVATMLADALGVVS
ncbi:MAG TPA: hypothetical protein VF614_01055 [Chthoniobacteraceae bacterium]|jgi:hypothetical protein